MRSGAGTFSLGRVRVTIVLAVLSVVAAAGAASGSTPARVVSAPARFFFPGTFGDAPAAAQPTTTTTAPPCQPAATLHQRAAEVLMVGLPNVTEPTAPLVDEVLQLGVGGVYISGANVDTRAQATRLISDMKARSPHPLIVSTDEEPGRVTSFGQIIGYTSSPRRLAREQSPTYVRQLAQTQATGLASMGVTLDLAPVADLDGGPSDATIGDRSFSTDPAVAAAYSYSYALGLADKGVGAVAKHFPGRAQAQGDDHLGKITSSETLDQLTASDLKPFGDLIQKGIPVVMVSNVDYLGLDPTEPASMSPRAYELLRQMGFQGVAITVSVGMGAVNQRWDWAEAAVKAIEAGADGVLTTDGTFAKDMVHGLVVAVQKGELSEDRLNQAAGRMIALAGGDPMAFACQSVALPKLQSQP
ncbi:MAG TPA: glycoside hydrolase family 3 N-terminal domain-containing protein [Acidimicrobiales bacterium]|nr:glycoside hydrolase family 3 N-terminal domain-containing protein [Acidimicrobiales bacterium]